MREMTIDEIKASEMDSLLLFRDFCRENGLRYYLTFGTLLGAVRHGGFIPWDDDVDVFLPRKDYDFLLENFNAWSKAAELKREVISKELEPRFYCNFAKITDRNTVVREEGRDFETGVWIDLFPLDEAPEGFFFRIRTDICVRLLSCSGAVIRKRRKWYKNLLTRLLRVFDPSGRKLWKRYKRLIEKTQSVRGGSYALLYRNFKPFGFPVLPKAVFDPPAELMFEGEVFTVPKKYDAFLHACYGDYMTLPPPEERKSRHNYTCVRKEET